LRGWSAWRYVEGACDETRSHIHGFEQFLLRALIFRLVSDELVRESFGLAAYAPDPFLRAVRLALEVA
jgi:hypothetical protein